MMNVGDATCPRTCSPAPMPCVSVVLPAPRSPVSTTRSPARSTSASARPYARVASASGSRTVTLIGRTASLSTCTRGTRAPIRVTIS